MDLHIAGALELFVDHLVHARAGIDQGGGNDGQAAALLHVTGGTEETFGPVQGIGVDTAGEYLTRGRDHRIVGARQPSDGV